MISIHLIDQTNRHLYQTALHDYFRTRHEIYVRERGWKELDKPDGLEIDQFDADDTVYIVALDDDRTAGGMRLVPTTSPTLLNDLFPYLSLRGLIRDPDIFELSRFFVTRPHRGEKAHPRLEALIQCATMEYGVAIGLRQFTIVCETWCVPLLHEQGWHSTPLGVPTLVDGLSTIAVAVDVSQNAVDAIRERRSIYQPSHLLLTHQMPPQPPAIRA
jgi:acyl-homoserine lactone synthase